MTPNGNRKAVVAVTNSIFSCGVNTSLKEVYREAAREKAASIGNVENVTESKEGNTYRIRIEIST